MFYKFAFRHQAGFYFCKAVYILRVAVIEKNHSSIHDN